jgi:signal transduction histidine kinase
MVSVQCGPVEDGVAITVQDTGIGISQDDLPHVFTKFYRASQGRTKRTGTGLGLALVKAIVDHHKGTVTVTSSPGEGSTFVLWLPTGTASLPSADGRIA